MLLITQLYRQRACIAVAPKTHTYTHTHTTIIIPAQWKKMVGSVTEEMMMLLFKKMAECVRPFFSSFSSLPPSCLFLQ